MDHYRAIGPLLRLLPAEAAHGLTVRALKYGLVPAPRAEDDRLLACRVWGRDFPNSIGLAAGFDKNAEVPDATLALGFGFVEVGSITPRPQPGNPKPRLFRLEEDEAVINRLGFNNAGMAAAVERLERRLGSGRRRPGIVGVNLGVDRDTADAAADYAAGARALGRFADYLVVNVSSPNTPDLRGLQSRAALEDLLARVRAGGETDERPPVVLKIAPDLEDAELAGIAAVAASGLADGLIISNTTTARPEGLRSRRRFETGGLSGRPLFGPSTEILGKMYRLTQGKVPLIGVGGVSCGREAYAKIRAGASLVQLYTALVFRGPGLIPRIKAELADLLRRDGFARLEDAVGADHRAKESSAAPGA